MTTSPVRLNHAVLYVTDLERSVGFCGDAFAMEVMAREPRANAALLRPPRSSNHDDVGLYVVGIAGGPERQGPSACTTSPGRLTPLTNRPARVELCATTGPTPASRATAPS